MWQFLQLFKEHSGIYVASKIKNNLRTLGSNTTGKDFPLPYNRLYSMSYMTHMNFRIRFILQPKKFEYLKYMISTFYTSNHDRTSTVDLADSLLIKFQCTKISFWMRTQFINYCLVKHISLEVAHHARNISL